MAAILGPKWSSKKLAESKVAFGSVEKRKMFPVHTAPTRFGIEQGLRGDPHRGPGCYDNDPVNTFMQPINARPISTRGFGFGADREKRGKDLLPSTEPGPGAYHDSIAAQEPVKTSYKPFSSAQQRFKEPPPTYNHLGPGSHEHNVERDRKVQFEESFGGQRRLRKTIVTKCTLGIPDKCCKCGQEPIGDYYENSKHQALCRPCYNEELKVKGQVKGMTKVRDCSAIHKHDFPGKTPKTIIKSDKEQKKLQYREAYMSLYYS